MTLLYQSTRDKSNKITASQAILQGLATDGGLYVPVEFPKLDWDFEKLKNASYQEIATLVLGAFFDDFTAKELENCVAQAYDAKFDTPEIAPLRQVGNHFVLELFHGETIAFKDMALSILPHLMTAAAKKNQVHDEIVILTATSGDTGKAAMAGFADVPNTQIIVFYPKNGVSKIQERQMLTQKGANVHVVGIDGNFDQAQTAVKQMFNDLALRAKMQQHGKRFSSANSMNIGRLVPQVAYYVYAYAQLIAQGHIKAGDSVNFAVPTGNFGNILAAHYAKKIGLPIHQLICASNRNRVLTDFFASGTYDKQREFYLTSSPSMDILVSSNLERLIFELTGQDDQATAQLLSNLTEKGQYHLSSEMLSNLTDFLAGSADEAATSTEITRSFKEDHYVLDPHTAVASSVARQFLSNLTEATVLVSTASPYKFPRVVVEALSQQKSDKDDFALVAELKDLSKIPVPKTVSELAEAPIRHQTVVQTQQMQQAVEAYLEL